MDNLALDELVRKALAEDIGHGDITTESVIPDDRWGEAQVVVKGSGVLAGLHALERVYAILDEDVIVTLLMKDGDTVEPGAVVAKLEGPVRSILTGERVALNFLMHLSGIATKTRMLSRLLEGTGAVLVDTRKTIPGLRQLEKHAVRMGGGSNHRFGLYDGVLIKDNHIAAAGGITSAVQAARKQIPHTVKIEVEVEDLEMVKEALEAGADIIMLDNMDIETMRKAVKMVGKRALVEASGGITEKNIRRVAGTGVNLISVGAITHSAPALDVSLDILKM